MGKIKIQTFKTRIGELLLGEYDNKLCLINYKYKKMRQTIDNRLMRYLEADYLVTDTLLLQKTRQQIDSYLSGKLKEFSLPLLLVGTDFQQQVWQALQTIEYGKTASYLDLAIQINNPKAVRALASANGANAISLAIPCHRIIGHNGSLVGYGGGLVNKEKLLKLEGATSKQQRLF